MSDDETMLQALRSLGRSGLLALELMSPKETMALAAVGMLPKEPYLLTFAASLHGMAAMCAAPRLEDRPRCLCCGEHVETLGLAVLLRARDQTAPWAMSFPTCAACEQTKTYEEIASGVMRTLKREFFPGMRRYDAANVFTEGGRA